MRAACRALDDLLTSALGRAQQALLGQGRLLRWIFGLFEVLEEFLARSCHEDVAWSGGDAVPWLVCVFFTKLDLSSVTARLRGSSCVVLSRGLAVVVCPGGGTILVMVSLWYLVVVGVEVDLCSVGVCGMTFHVLCFYSSSNWAQSAHRFSACEHDKGVCRVLNATALVVVFCLPTEMRSSSACMPRVAPRSAEQSSASSARLGEATAVDFRAIRSSGGVFGALSPRGRLMEWGRGCAVVGSRVLREGVVLVGLHCSLACACGATVGPFVRDCETERGLAVVVCPGGGTILVVVSLWYLMVVGVEVDLCSVGVCGMTFHVLCFYSSSKYGFRGWFALGNGLGPYALLRAEELDDKCDSTWMAGVELFHQASSPSLPEFGIGENPLRTRREGECLSVQTWLGFEDSMVSRCQATCPNLSYLVTVRAKDFFIGQPMEEVEVNPQSHSRNHRVKSVEEVDTGVSCDLIVELPTGDFAVISYSVEEVKSRVGPEMKQDLLLSCWNWRPGVAVDLLASSLVDVYCMNLAAVDVDAE
ncbi:hypothetical protein Taro_023017, partial [Colocasia esculenta]|nr:hypothetical protein [Colocasia esculenta]